MKRLSSIACTGSRSKKSVALTAFQTLIATKVPWGRYSAASWVSGTNTLTDLTGNGRSATTSGVASGSASGNGATASIAYLGGTTTTYIQWPAGCIPATATFASITRYATVGTKRRVLTGGSVNFIHGHYNGGRGIVYYGDRFLEQATVGTATDWVGMVSTNNAAAAFPNNVLVDGVARGIAVGGAGGTGALPDLRINNEGFATGETSDFQFAYLLIWDQALTASEMATVATALNTYLSTGVLQ